MTAGGDKGKAEREEMERIEKSSILVWIKGWENAGSVLRKEREERLQNVDVGQIIEELEDAFQSAMRHLDDSKLSGLIELQYYFKRMRM